MKQKDAYTYLMEHGIKPSPQRMAVMEYLMANPVHPTVETIHAALVGRMPTLSKTTVYNTLKLFVESGAALILTINEKMANFDADVAPHAHFLCTECGEIYDIAEDEDLVKQATALPEQFYVDTTSVYMRGICPKCLSKNNK